METKIQPVILCGGSGTRLWPISTHKIPKQFISLGEEGTLLENTIRRINLVLQRCKDKQYEICDPLLIMHHMHSLPSELSMYEPGVIYEPYANDTAVAMAKAALEIKNRQLTEYKKTIMLVLPADHYIEYVNEFVEDLYSGIEQVTNDNIVLFGIEATSPETKYGYIIPGPPVTFKEKPNKETASYLVEQGALWNSGIIAANVDTVLNALKLSDYNIMEWITNPRPGKAPSFDVAVLQEHSHITAHRCRNWKWSDVGTWDAFTEIPAVKAEMENASSIILKESQNVNVLNRSAGNVVVIGCSNLLVVSNGPDLLIMHTKGSYNDQLKEIASRFT